MLFSRNLSSYFVVLIAVPGRKVMFHYSGSSNAFVTVGSICSISFIHIYPVSQYLPLVLPLAYLFGIPIFFQELMNLTPSINLSVPGYPVVLMNENMFG